MKYNELIGHIEKLHHGWLAEATKAINISLTLRNWMIGYYIVEYQQDGEDRAEYGTGLLKKLESELKPTGIKGMTERSFRNYRKLYHTYPNIRGLITAESDLPSIVALLPMFTIESIRQSPTAESENDVIVPIGDRRYGRTNIRKTILSQPPR